MLHFMGRAILDALGSLVGRPPRLVPLVAKPGTVALLTTPDSQRTNEALNPGNKYPDWLQLVAARSALRVTFYRPGRLASQVKVPLLVVVADQDQSALAAPSIAAAGRAPLGELVRVPGGHYAPFLEQHEPVVEAELAFLRRHVLNHPTSTAEEPDAAAPSSAAGYPGAAGQSGATGEPDNASSALVEPVSGLRQRT
jgi:pimeloyl-ACP methyl ester carboxylesterase